MSWNFVMCQENLFQTDVESFSFLSWKTKKSFLPKKYDLGQESSNRWCFAVSIFIEGFDLS